jgi:hypothetical protein
MPLIFFFFHSGYMNNIISSTAPLLLSSPAKKEKKWNNQRLHGKLRILLNFTTVRISSHFYIVRWAVKNCLLLCPLVSICAHDLMKYINLANIWRTNNQTKFFWSYSTLLYASVNKICANSNQPSQNFLPWQSKTKPQCVCGTLW